MRKIITGIIGYGIVGKRRHFFLKKIKYSVKYISDILFEKNYRKNDIHYFKKYLDLLNQQDLDVVFITLPNYLAPIVTKQALKKKLHVFCEKPPAKNVRDLKSVINVEKNRNLKIKIWI